MADGADRLLSQAVRLETEYSSGILGVQMSKNGQSASKEKSLPLYLCVSESIRKKIDSGEFPVGTLLPTESEMCQKYQVSRFTVREAIRHLQSLGRVESRQGQGTRVVAANEVRLLSSLLQSVEDVERHGLLTRMVDIETRNIEADAELAATLPCEIGQKYLKIQCYREPLDQTVALPVAWNVMYVIDEYAGLREMIGKRDVHMLTLLEEQFNENVTSIVQEISGLILDGKIAERLQVESGSAGLRMKRTYSGHRGRNILVGYNTYPADRFTFRMHLRNSRHGAVDAAEPIRP